MRRLALPALLLLLASSALAGCGNKGPLFLPPARVTATPATTPAPAATNGMPAAAATVALPATAMTAATPVPASSTD